MLKAVEGLYRNGQIELQEKPEDMGESRVIVTFLSPDESKPDMTPAEIAELRGKLAAWEEDWNAPGMEIYDTL